MISDGKKDFIYDELNQQVEVREVTTTCAAAGQGTGSFDSQANAGAGGTPAAVLCYGAGPLIERNGYGPDGMRALRDVQIAPASSQYKRQIYARLGGSVVREFTEEANPAAANAIQVSHEKTYVYGPLGLLATEELCSFACKSDEVQNAPATRYYEYDHLGTIRAITNNNGNLESTFDYEPFGLELKSANAAFTWWTDTSSNTHKFTGHERDEEAGEDYMKARMYVLSTARFPQIDPQFGGAGNPQNWNAYIYVMNSPVGSSDPTGMLPSSQYNGPNAVGAEDQMAHATAGGVTEAFQETRSNAEVAASQTSTPATQLTGNGSSGQAAAPNPANTTTNVGVVNTDASSGGGGGIQMAQNQPPQPAPGGTLAPAAPAAPAAPTPPAFTQSQINQTAGVVYNETRSLSGGPAGQLHQGRINVARARLNAISHRGRHPAVASSRGPSARTLRNPAERAAWADAQAATREAAESGDFLGGAVHFNLRGNAGTGNFQQSPSHPGYPVIRQTGPFNNSFPTTGSQGLPAQGVFLNVYQ